MGVSVVSLLALVVYGIPLGLAVVFFRRHVQNVREGPDETVQQRIMDEVDQLHVQIQIANERLKRIEDGFLLGSGGDGRTEALSRDHGGGENNGL